MQIQTYDVIISGSGLIGAAMAIALGQGGLRVAVVEAALPTERLSHGHDGRVSAIAKASVNILSSIGVWNKIEDRGPILDIRVLDEKGHFYVHYDHQEAGGEPFGYMVENRHLRLALLDVLEDTQNVTTFQPDSITDIQNMPSQAQVALKSGAVLRAPLLLVADGKFSATRKLLNIDSRELDYGHTAMVCTIRHSLPHQGLALEKFRNAGPFAVLPMSGGRSNIVWAEAPELATRILELSEQERLDELKARLGDYLGDVEVIGKFHSYPLKLILANDITAPRTILIGDAAHAIHPVAGQGANLGYRDVAVLAELIMDHARLGLDIGSTQLQSSYRAARKTDVLSMTAFTDGITRLFSTSVPPLLWARDMGLGAVEKVPPLKRYLMKHAMGMAGDLPRMMKGEAA